MSGGQTRTRRRWLCVNPKAPLWTKTPLPLPLCQESVPQKADTISRYAPRAARKYDGLAVTQCLRSAAWQYLDDPTAKKIISEGAVDLYQGLEPKDGLQAAMSLLLVGVTNASLDCMSIAARVPPQEMECRELNLRYGLKGAEVAAKLAETLERVRGNAPSKVSVGKVNVESGGQAIVGNVEAGRHAKDADPHPTPDEPRTNKPEAA